MKRGCSMSEEMVEYKKECPVCHTVNTLMLKKSEIESYQNGAHVQDAFGRLSPSEREILITGICGKCWDKMFKEEE